MHFVFKSVIAAMFVIGASLGATAKAQFVGGIDDLPLMPGLTEMVDESIVFETPQGRIVEAVAAGLPSPQEIQDFYDRALPQLGWENTGTGRYRREGEVLSVEFQSGSPPRVRFRLAPGP